MLFVKKDLLAFETCNLKFFGIIKSNFFKN